MAVYRSLLFVPGDQARKIKGALKYAADGIIVDLEDAVAESNKEVARQQAETVLKQLSMNGDLSCRVFIRVNGLDTSYGREDIARALHWPIAGLVIPKTESAEALVEVEGYLSKDSGGGGQHEDNSDEAMEIIPMIESALGLENALDFANASARIKRLAFGAIDYSVDMHLIIDEDTGRDEQVLLFARSRLAHVSRVSGLNPPIDTPWSTLGDLDGCFDSAKRSRNLGFQGKLCIHPEQIDIVNRAFSASKNELETAQRVVLAFEKASSESIAAVKVEGKMVDYAVYYKAKQLLSQQ